MSRTSLLIGLLVSGVGHVIALWPVEPNRQPPDTAARTLDARAAAIAVAAVQPPPMPKPERPPETQALRRPAAPRTPALDRLLRPTATDDDASGNQARGEEHDDTPPTLRIAWHSPDHMLAVARALDLHIVAVDRQQSIVGQIDIHDPPRLTPFTSTLSRFSNRIRTLPRDYFGRLADDAVASVTALWILVPSAVDQNLIDEQRRAIRKAGRDVSEVSATEGHFERRNGSYRLIITNLL